MRNLYNLMGGGKNPQLSSAPQHETKKSRKNLLSLFALLLLAMGWGNGKADAAVTELPLDDNWGNTVYFTITDHTHHYVEYVCPNENNVSWDGFDKPEGILDLPGTFDYMGVDYTATSIGNAAFNGCSGVYAVTIPSTITSISSNAFNGTSLIQVNLNSNAIASAQYGSWYNLRSIFGNNIQGYSFGPEVTAIGPCALYGCQFLESVTFNGNVTTFGYEAFENCTGLESMTIPNSVTTIGNGAFSGCTGLTEVTMGSGVTFVALYAFRYCENLTRVNVVDLAAWCAIDFDPWDANPLFYAHNLYYNNSLITDLVIPNSVTTIGTDAFCYCSSLTSVTIPNSVTTIGAGAFFGCTGLTSVTIGDGVTTVLGNAFNGCSSLERVNISNLAAWSQINFTEYTANPLYYAHHLYLNNSLVTSLTIPSGVTSIGSYAFYGCTDPTTVTIPNSVTFIGAQAFIGCTGLTRVITPSLAAWCQIIFANELANPLSFVHHLYNANNSEITNLDIPYYGYLTSIGDYAFAGGTSFVSVTLRNNLTSIGQYAFKGCTGLTSVSIPSSMTSVGNYAFEGCTGLASVTINSHAVASASYSIYSYFLSTPDDNFKTRFGNQVTSYTFGPDVTAIGNNALNSCTGVTQVTFLGPVSYLGIDAFEGCTGLTRVDIADLAAWCGVIFGTNNYDHFNKSPLVQAQHIYHNGSLLTELTIPSSVTSVGNYAFYGCTDLTSVTINSNAVASASYSIHSYSYYSSTPDDNFKTRFGDQVTSYTFGPEVTAIGQYALYGCTGITELYVGAMTPPTIYWNTFTNVSRSIPVYVPVGTGALYRAAEYWSQFTNFVETIFPGGWVEIPYTQDFGANTLPESWKCYIGSLVGNNSPYTATLTPESGRWHFGAANGVFGGSSHAWVNIGGYLHHFWLVSPFLQLGDNNYMLSVDLALTRPSGTMVPITPDAQDNTIIKVLISTDYGATWIPLQSWKHEMGYTDLESLTPEGYTCTYNLSAYANQDILIGFYMECTDPDDASNRIHIDNFNVTSFDPTLPPTAVTVSEIAGHSAKVSWTPASPVQYKWDVIVAHVAFNPNTDNMEQLGYYDGVMEHVNGYRYKTITGLIPNYDSYKAWVRYNDGSVTSEWVASASFETDVICPMPSDITIVEHGLHSATITWTPGDENQTSWYIYVDNYHDMDGEELEEPSFTMNNLIPGENYDFYLLGYCGEDGESDPVNVDFTMSDYPSLTVNENTTSWDEYVVISGHETVNSCSRTQFIIPSNMLTPMQYSTIIDMKFYPKYYQGTQPWGQFAAFNVYVKEVEENNLGSYCGDSFYPWESMTTIYTGSLYIQNGVMTIQFPEGTPFSYHEGNLLIGIAQINNGYGEDCQISWYAAGNNPNSALYEPNGLDPECIHSLPKVTFTYETDPYLPPTNLVVTPTAPTEVTLTWTPREGQTATDVQLLDEDMEPIDTWTWGGGNVFGLANLDPGTDYYVSLRGQFTVGSGTYYSAWTNPVPFSTPDYCDAPDNLQVNEVGPFSATLNWVSGAEYDEVEYRALEIQWEEGFEGLSGDALPSGWTKFYNGNGQGSGGWWNYGTHNGVPPHSGERQMRSSGFSTYLSDNWLILPQMELGGVLKLWACTTQGTQQSFSVYVSTTGTNIADFGTTPVMTGSPSSYQEFIIDLSGFEGSGYVAIRHQDVPSGCTLVIDDVTYLNGGDWTSLGYVEGGQYDFEGLTPGTTYQARVRSMCEVGDASYPGYWTDPVSFSTVNNIVFQDPVAKSASVYIGDTNGDGELSYAEAAAITNLGTIFQNQVEMQYFNELQYFIGLTAIGDNAFSGCDNLSAITLPPTITSIGYNAFGYTVNQQGQTIPCSSLHNIVIPPSVTTIGAFAFRRSGLTEVILPPSVTSIGDLAFGECNNLEYIYLPASVTIIEGNAFTGTSIETIEVDQDNIYFDSRGGCNAIIRSATNNTFPNTLITGCKNTVIPDYVVSIGISAFENATGLTTITLPSSVESIGEHAFANCSGLTTINAERPLPPTIYSNTFINMVHSNVTVNVPCGALSDYRNAEIWSGLSFNYVDPCNIVFADANVKAICVSNWDTNGDGQLSYAEAAAVGYGALANVFKNNTTIETFNELQYFTGMPGIYPGAFEGCTSLQEVTLPMNTQIVASRAFFGCSALSYVGNLDKVQTIIDQAFMYCTALTGLNFGPNLTTIGDGAFNGCTQLTYIVVECTTPPAFGYTPTSTFYDVPKSIPVYVPCGSVADYQTYNNGAPWGGFNSIQGMGCENSRYLSAGWTWWVPYLDVTADELRNAFDEGTITGDILINSQSEGFLRRTNGEWGGTLSDFVVGKMYKIKTVSDGSFNYNGTRPTTVAVAIEPGYNWFGIQGNSTAIATLITPANGDKILKDDGTWVTFDGTYWIFDNGAYSSSFVIQPGIGYIYYNATNETKTMTFSY